MPRPAFWSHILERDVQTYDLKPKVTIYADIQTIIKNSCWEHFKLILYQIFNPFLLLFNAKWKKPSALLCPGWHPDFWAPHKTSKQKTAAKNSPVFMQHFFAASWPPIDPINFMLWVQPMRSRIPFFSCVVRSHACNFCSQKLRGVKCGICFASRSHTSKFQDVREKTYKFPASVMQLWDVNLWNLKKPCPFQPVQGRPVRGFSPLLSSVVGNVKIGRAFFRVCQLMACWKLAIPKGKGSIFQPSIFRVLC